MIKAKKGIVLLYKDLCGKWFELLKGSDISFLGLHTLYMYGGMKSYMEWVQTSEARRQIERFENEGIVVEHELHAIDYLLPRNLFEKDPTLFRENDKGERTADYNLCVSNLEALDRISESAYRVARTLRQSSNRYFLWRDDHANTNCHCEKCRLLGGADQNLITMKAILKGLRAYDNEAKLSFLAYLDSFEQPTLPIDEGLFLEFAPINRNHRASISSQDETNKRNRSILQNLLRRFKASDAQILEYFLDVSLQSNYKREDARPLMLDEEQLREDINFYDSLGIGYITTFAAFIDEKWLSSFGTEKIMHYLNL